MNESWHTRKCVMSHKSARTHTHTHTHTYTLTHSGWLAWQKTATVSQKHGQNGRLLSVYNWVMAHKQMRHVIHTRTHTHTPMRTHTGWLAWQKTAIVLKARTKWYGRLLNACHLLPGNHSIWQVSPFNCEWVMLYVHICEYNSCAFRKFEYNRWW